MSTEIIEAYQSGASVYDIAATYKELLTAEEVFEILYNAGQI